MYYAHSGTGFAPQTYFEHITNVQSMSVKYAIEATRCSKHPEQQKKLFIDSIAVAATYHDVGKLFDDSQTVLSSHVEIDGAKLINHVDAGVAACISLYESTNNKVFFYSAWLIHAHHIGLDNFDSLYVNTKEFFPRKVPSERFRDDKVKEITDTNLSELLRRHDESGIVFPEINKNTKASLDAGDIRMALSCLVDADHTDTTDFYYKYRSPELLAELHPNEQLALVNNHVETLKTDTDRSRMRSLLFSCATQLYDSPFLCMDAPVGTGKTFAILGGSLTVAAQRKHSRIFTILPFTNVISQTVKEYRKCLTVPVNEIHSKVEFNDPKFARYSHQWNLPVTVTTSVQFFESLVSNHPAELRKLHWFANSVIALDEFHSMTQHSYWDYNLTLLGNLAKWGSTVLFSSGTPVYYWELFGRELDVTQIVSGETYKLFQSKEIERIKRIRIKEKLTIGNLCNKILETDADKILVVLNTVKNALVIFDELKKKTNRKILHISTVLNQHDKGRALEKVKSAERIILVATSVVECGMDVSFNIGYRERINLLQKCQFDGRVGRNCEPDCTVYDFEFSESCESILTENPCNYNGIEIYNSLKTEEITPAYCTKVVADELSMENLSNLNINTRATAS